MCGIFIIRGTKCCLSYIESEFNKSSKRGPDASRFMEMSGNYIGFHRLAINGLDPNGMQPFVKNNCYLICNGEIYNHKDLYLMLNKTPNSGSDCEVILDLYLEFGIEYTCKILDGVFAFILVDGDSVYFARDPFGVRPLYYFDCGGGIFGASSELKSLINFNTNIKQFPPGHFGHFGHKNIVIYNYFTLNSTTLEYNNIYTGYDYYKILVKNSLINAVKKRLMSERPIACLLSGGLDSSLITSIVVNLLPQQKIKTFSIGLLGSPDLKYAREVAKFLRTDHHEVIVTEKEFLEAIPVVIKTIESYDTTTVRASVGNYLIAKYISDNSDSKVIFNGDGSDELTGGYLYFHKSPSRLHSDSETVKLLSNISYFDVLRSDKCISSCGLEPRTPFLDKSFVTTYRSIPLNVRFQVGTIEKKLLRDSFVEYLPHSVLYRQKEAFSDGVSNEKRSWFKIIQEYVDTVKFKSINVSYNVPNTKEQEYYRYLYETEYPNTSHIIPYFWMPRWSDTTDPSARTLK
jgi:asparagine synthase (glutamine-hydrolysing)